MLIGKRRSVDVGNGAHGAIALFRLESGSEASGASVAVKAEGSEFVGERVRTGEDEDRQ